MDGVTFVNETPYVLSLAGVESVDPNTGRSTRGGQCRARQRHASLRPGQRRGPPLHATGPTLGRRPTSASVQRILAKIGTFWIDSLTPTESTRGVSMRLLDRLATLARLQVNYGPTSAVRLDAVAPGS